MPKGISLHVGVNETDPDCFALSPLDGCVNDATAMYYLAKLRGFTERRLLTDKEATFENVTKMIQYAAGELVSEGDVFLFTFAGHGTQVSDEDGELFEFQDEAIVLHDRILIDDVLRRRYWPKFNPGVRVIFVTDCCHGGTLLEAPLAATEPREADKIVRERLLPDDVRHDHLEKFPNFYTKILSNLAPPADLQSSLIHLAACPDERKTPDGLPHGLFTEVLLEVWDDGSFAGTYEEFRQKIESHPKLVARGQIPTIERELGRPLTPPFREQKPIFKI